MIFLDGGFTHLAYGPCKVKGIRFLAVPIKGYQRRSFFLSMPKSVIYDEDKDLFIFPEGTELKAYGTGFVLEVMYED